MQQTHLFRFLYLAFLSHPARDRALYRLIHKRKMASIVELGIGSALRSQRMIETAQRRRHGRDVRLTAVDLFEDRGPERPGVTLKRAHRVLCASGARVQLVPGDPFAALARCANDLAGTDLVVVSADQDRGSLERAWFYLPRMLHDGSLVLREKPGDEATGYEILTRADVLAAQPAARAA